MATALAELPRFKKPPVIELALGVQFEMLQAFRTVHFGSWWQEIRGQFPAFQEQPPLNELVEDFDAPRQVSLNFDLLEGIPLPRLWFLNTDGSELIQLQQNRLVYNWRRQRQEDEYPHYKSIREKFAAALLKFGDFVKREKLGAVKPSICEVTYVNHIESEGVWNQPGEAAKVFSIVNSPKKPAFLPEAEHFGFSAAYVIKNESQPIGRLRVGITPQLRFADKKPIFVMNNSARGVPSTKDIEGILKFLDIGHRWIVRGFDELTTEAMHEKWGKA